MKTPLTKKQIIFWALVTMLVIEGVTVFARFGLGLESTRDTASTVGLLTGGIRIHHGYVGMLMIVLAFVALRRWQVLPRWTIVLGAALVGSDLIHHFVVLWAATGHHHFDLVY